MRQRSASWRLLRLPLIAGTSLLTACTGQVSSTAGTCSVLPLRTYTPAFNAQLAGEVVAASPGAVWPQAVQDYAGLRDAVRACWG